MNKLILIMIDGVSSAKFEEIRHQLPHLDRLAKEGTQVQALTPEICGTSFPGRTSMIVGRPASEHGIYGNKIWDGNVFRWSNPYDVRTETIASLTKQAGGDVVNMGYGMVRPEDCDLYVSPWWVGDVMSRARDNEPHPANHLWTMKNKQLDPKKRLQNIGLSADDIVDPATNKALTLDLGTLADYQLMEMAADLIERDRAPNLLMLEVAVTDYYLHQYGSKHPLTELSLRNGDAQVGTLIERLRKAGKLEQYNFAIMSDHGHHLMADAIYCDVLLPEGTRWSSEGGMLLIAPTSAEQGADVTQKLLAQGLEQYPHDFLPDDMKDTLLAFTSAQGQYISFEADLKKTGKVRGVSKYQSNHGMRPGTLEDYRFCLFSGPDVTKQIVPFAQAIQVAPTIAKILGVNTPWQTPSII